MKRNGVILTLLTVISLLLSLSQNLTANVSQVEQGKTKLSNLQPEIIQLTLRQTQDAVPCMVSVSNHHAEVLGFCGGLNWYPGLIPRF